MPRGIDGLDIAVIGTGIAGMSAAWLLNQGHRVTVYEQDTRLGGHSNTIVAPGDGSALPVDMGFIVFNERTYPNLTALFRHLGVATQPSEMSFAVSMADGDLEYAGTDLFGLFAQKRNLLRPRFWSMLRDLLRFYREAPRSQARLDPFISLGDFLRVGGYGRAFIEDHLLPMAAAIWSTPADRVGEQPAASFIRFCDNHGLLQVAHRPAWRTVTGGSRAYIAKLTASYASAIRTGCGIRAVERHNGCVLLHDTAGRTHRHDHVVIATHADQALALLADPSPQEQRILGALRYGANEAFMHDDPALMPRRRKVWASWNYLGGGAGAAPCVTYWMNKLQTLPGQRDIFVTLNPVHRPASERMIHYESYMHPLFDAGALAAQQNLWSLQGTRRSWFCGAYFGAGFHEDGLQAGLAVAEQLGGLRRPWAVAGESNRIHITVPA